MTDIPQCLGFSAYILVCRYLPAPDLLIRDEERLGVLHPAGLDLSKDDTVTGDDLIKD